MNPLEHQNVPESHRGLHDFLYSSEDEHSINEVTVSPILKNDGTEISTIANWCENNLNSKVAGVYAVLNEKHCPQYVGYSRNIMIALNSHVAQLGKVTCAFVRVQSFKYPKRIELENLRDIWLNELESIPDGNSTESGLWASTVGEAAQLAMSVNERNAYEEKKLKLRKAIADTTLNTSESADINDTQRRQKLESAVVNDDWSQIINDSSK